MENVHCFLVVRRVPRGGGMVEPPLYTLQTAPKGPTGKLKYQNKEISIFSSCSRAPFNDIKQNKRFCITAFPNIHGTECNYQTL